MTGIEYNSRYNLQENTMFDREQITGYVSADDVCDNSRQM